MPLIRIPTPFRYYTNGEVEFATTGKTVSEAIEQLFTEYGTLKKHLVDEKKELRRFVNLFVNDVNIRELDGLMTELKEDDRLSIIPSIAGG